MPSFKEVAADWQKQNSFGKIDCDLLFSIIGDIDIKKLTSEKIQECLSQLYDNAKVRGIVFASYERFISSICEFAFDNGYISEVPQIEHRREPDPNLYFKPEESAMERLLSHEDCTPVGTILRLAWYCGLKRNEITFLLWEQVDLEIMELVLPDRKVPLEYKMVMYLSRLYEQNAAYSEYVLISQRKSAPMAEQSVSALVRKTLDNYGQNNVRLSDLRSDFIIKTLNESSWEYVSYISGVDLPALQQHYLPYISDKKTMREDIKPQIDQYVRYGLLRFIKNKETGLVGLAIRFVWQMGIPVSVLPSLTWEIIDFKKSTAKFIDRSIRIPNEFLRILHKEKSLQTGEYKNILLNDCKKKPTDSFFIQKAVQQALIREGMSGITLSTLQNDYWNQNYSVLISLLTSGTLASPDVRKSELFSVPKSFPKGFFKAPADELLQYLAANGASDYKSLTSNLSLNEKEISLLLKETIKEGKITKFGLRYFLSTQVVQRDKQKEVILSYVEKHQPVTSAEITKLLGLADRRQIYQVIGPMLKSRELIRLRVNRYCLPNYQYQT